MIDENSVLDKTLLLMRHGKSDWYAGADSDHERPLNSRGREESAAAGVFLDRNGLVPVLVLCSTASRTRETWTTVRDAAGWKDIPVVHLDELYLAPVAKAFEILAEHISRVETLMMVGHQPILSGLVSRIAAGSSLEVPTATLAVLQVPGRMTTGSGQLTALVTPREFPTTNL
ncbi:MAG: histidine phosphatase family protein [Rhodothermales bacterium]